MKETMNIEAIVAMIETAGDEAATVLGNKLTKKYMSGLLTSVGIRPEGDKFAVAMQLCQIGRAHV